MPKQSRAHGAMGGRWTPGRPWLYPGSPRRSVLSRQVTIASKQKRVYLSCRSLGNSLLKVQKIFVKNPNIIRSKQNFNCQSATTHRQGLSKGLPHATRSTNGRRSNDSHKCFPIKVPNAVFNSNRLLKKTISELLVPKQCCWPRLPTVWGRIRSILESVFKINSI